MSPGRSFQHPEKACHSDQNEPFTTMRNVSYKVFKFGISFSLAISILLELALPALSQSTSSPLPVVAGHRISRENAGELLTGFYRLTPAMLDRNGSAQRNSVAKVPACRKAMVEGIRQYQRARTRPTDQTWQRCNLAALILIILESETGGPFWTKIYQETPADPKARSALALSAADAIAALQGDRYAPFSLGAPTVSSTTTADATPSPPGCRPDRPVFAVQKVTPEMPDDARGASGTVIIEVQVDNTGRVMSTIIQRSSNNKALDDATVSAARRSKYSPAIRNCVAVPGMYRYVVTFES